MKRPKLFKKFKTLGYIKQEWLQEDGKQDQRNVYVINCGLLMILWLGSWSFMDALSYFVFHVVQEQIYYCLRSWCVGLLHL